MRTDTGTRLPAREVDTSQSERSRCYQCKLLPAGTRFQGHLHSSNPQPNDLELVTTNGGRLVGSFLHS